jgi:ubiquinone/menaquinone biosynthesis C-methylase UbiE
MDLDENKWNMLHEMPRFRPLYPNEFVVRFLFGQFPSALEQRRDIKILDIGSGAGRHVKLFAEQGFDVSAVDFSEVGIKETENMLRSFKLTAKLLHGDMKKLPCESNTYDGAISCGVFYYSDKSGMKKAIDELYRVLKKGGRAIITTKTKEDYRYGKGTEVETNTYIIDIKETNEQGMILHFIDKNDVDEYFSKYEKINIEKYTYTYSNMELLNSEFIISVIK